MNKNKILRDALVLCGIAALILSVAPGITPVNDDGQYFNYRAVQAIAPGYFPLNQGPIGTCVAVGHKGAIDGAQAIERMTGKASEWVPVSAESIYGVARNESKGRACRSFSDGSSGYDATSGITKVGVTYQKPYPAYGLDLSSYDVHRAKEWGAYGNGGRADGIGGPFDQEAGKHVVRDTAKVTTLEELDAALKNGLFVTICSGQGFNTPRDSEGFCAPRGHWSHCLLCTAKRLEGRKGYLIQNSWGAYIKGDDGDPKNPSANQYRDQPDGSFYAEPAIVARMLRAGDSYAISGQSGFERKLLPSWLTTPDAAAPSPVLVKADETDAEQEARNTRVYQRGGRWYFQDDNGRILEYKGGAWYYCNGSSCRRVS